MGHRAKLEERQIGLGGKGRAGREARRVDGDWDYATRRGSGLMLGEMVDRQTEVWHGFSSLLPGSRSA